MAELKITKVKASDLVRYEGNPRKNDKAIQAVRASVLKFGYVNPIIINADNVILSGHTRLSALEEMGEEDIECIRVSHLNEEEEKAFRIADNRAGQFSRWDKNLLEKEIKEIDEDDWENLGFKTKELEFLKPPRECTCPRCGKNFIQV